MSAEAPDRLSSKIEQLRQRSQYRTASFDEVAVGDYDAYEAVPVDEDPVPRILLGEDDEEPRGTDWLQRVSEVLGFTTCVAAFGIIGLGLWLWFG